MGAILDAAKAYFDGIGWVYETSDDPPGLELHFAGDWGLWRVVVLAREVAGQAAVYSILPFDCPSDAFARAYELVARINWGLPVGCFEVGDSGAIRFRIGVDFGDAEPQAELIGAAVRLNLRTMDRYIRAFAPVLVEGQDIVQIVAGLERG